MKKNKYVLCREVEIILLSVISQAGGRVGRKGEVMKVEAGLSENRKGIHGERQMWVIGR